MQSETFPDKFGGLLHANPAVHADTLRYMVRAFRALEKFEELARTDVFFEDFVREMVWPSQPWCRELLIGAVEAGDKALPEPALDEVMAAGAAFHTTQANENVNNFLRDVDRLNKSTAMSRMSRWHKTTCSNMLDDFDRKQITVLDEDKSSQVKTFPPAVPQAKNGDLTLDEDHVSKMSDPKKPWASPKQDSPHKM